jgi:hypothetical protein
MLSPTYALSASWFEVEASDGIFPFIVDISLVFPLIAESIVTILSRTAFLLGAIHVTPSQVVASYAVSLTAPAVALAMLSSTYFLVAGLQSYAGVYGVA